MVTLYHLNRPQKTVIWSTITAIILATVFVLLAYFFIPLSLPLLDTQERLIFTLRCQIFPALMLLAGIIAVSFNRFTSKAIDPLAGAEPASMSVHLRYLSNTLEQFILFLIASLVFSSFLDSHSIKLIPIFTILFVLGRIAFWLGYLQHPLNRGFGMVITLYPTIIMLLYDAYHVLGG